MSLPDAEPVMMTFRKSSCCCACWAYSGLFGAMQDMLTNAELRQANAYAGRILLSASCVKVQAPLPMGVRSTRPGHEPPQVEYTLWVDVYEVSCSALLATEVQAEVSFGPHVLKSPTLMLEEAGSYTLEAAQGRMEELKLYLPGMPPRASIAVHI